MIIERSEALHSRCKAAKRGNGMKDGDFPVLIPFCLDHVDFSICLQEDFKVAPRLPVT